MDVLIATLRGSLWRNKKHAAIPRTPQIKAVIRIDQAKPILGVRYNIMRGKATPPRPPAVHAMPVANARRLQNQCPITATLGLKSRDAEVPPSTPKDSKNW
jgi:hypothetical protein